VTPRRQLAIDAGAMSELVAFLTSKGVDGVVLFGSTGEFVHFDLCDRARLVREIARRHKLPVLVNCSHSTLDGTIELARRALGDGAAAAVAMPPYYFRYTQPQVREFFLRLGDAVDGPLSLYNIPLFTTPLELSTARGLLATGRFCAIKDSSGEHAYVEGLLADRAPNVEVYVGNDASYRYLRAKGASGAVSGVSSCVPELMVALERAIVSNDEARASSAEGLLSEFLAWFHQFPVPLAISEALHVRCGFRCSSACPLDAETMAKLQQFRAWCKEWFQVVESQCK
jgi:dihydrodipicolinate synthase/N-acetylneuraminate lyase